MGVGAYSLLCGLEREEGFWGIHLSYWLIVRIRTVDGLLVAGSGVYSNLRYWGVSVNVCKLEVSCFSSLIWQAVLLSTQGLVCAMETV